MWPTQVWQLRFFPPIIYDIQSIRQKNNLSNAIHILSLTNSLGMLSFMRVTLSQSNSTLIHSEFLNAPSGHWSHCLVTVYQVPAKSKSIQTPWFQSQVLLCWAKWQGFHQTKTDFSSQDFQTSGSSGKGVINRIWGWAGKEFWYPLPWIKYLPALPPPPPGLIMLQVGESVRWAVMFSFAMCMGILITVTPPST